MGVCAVRRCSHVAAHELLESDVSRLRLSSPGHAAPLLKSGGAGEKAGILARSSCSTPPTGGAMSLRRRRPSPSQGWGATWTWWYQGLGTSPGSSLGAPDGAWGSAGGGGGSEGCRDGQAGTKQPAPRPPLQGPSRPPAQGQQPASSVPPLPCSHQSRGSHPLGSHRPAGAGSQPCATPDCASISARRAVQGGRASFLFSL